MPGEDAGSVIVSGTASLEAAAGIGGGIEAVGSRVITLLLKALPVAATDFPLRSVPLVPVRRIGNRDVLFRSAKDVARAAARAAYQLCCHGSHWRVGWRFVEPGDDVWTRRDLSGKRWNVLADPVDHFYADPFPLNWQGRDYLFFEDLDHKTDKGIIAVVAFDEAGRPGPTMPVLEEPWHLSYPFLIERGGEIFMIPESSANRDIALYRAVEFPLKWERHAVLVDNVEAADATIVEHDGLLFMFAVVRDGVGGYSDTLAIWWSADLLGPWQPHPAKPGAGRRPHCASRRQHGSQERRALPAGAGLPPRLWRRARLHEGDAARPRRFCAGERRRDLRRRPLAGQAPAHAELQWPPRSDRRFYATPEVQIPGRYRGSLVPAQSLMLWSFCLWHQRVHDARVGHAGLRVDQPESVLEIPMRPADAALLPPAGAPPPASRGAIVAARGRKARRTH